jgi:hypothetical protein
MDIHKIETLLRKTRQQLKWKVIYGRSPDTLIPVIKCDPGHKKHEIVFPESYDSSVANLDMLHELTHALLAETVSPAFAGGQIRFRTERGGQVWRNYVTVPVQVATDWFVDGWFMNKSPGLAKEYLGIRIGMALAPFVKSRKLPSGNLDSDRCGLALLTAQSEKYGIGSYIDDIDDDGLKTAVRLFLSVDETKPTHDALLDLKNDLVAVSTPDLLVGYDPPTHTWFLGERQGSSWSRI